jgi:hypothetical protein
MSISGTRSLSSSSSVFNSISEPESIRGQSSSGTPADYSPSDALTARVSVSGYSSASSVFPDVSDVSQSTSSSVFPDVSKSTSSATCPGVSDLFRSYSSAVTFLSESGSRSSSGTRGRPKKQQSRRDRRKTGR